MLLQALEDKGLTEEELNDYTVKKCLCVWACGEPTHELLIVVGWLATGRSRPDSPSRATSHELGVCAVGRLGDYGRCMGDGRLRSRLLRHCAALELSAPVTCPAGGISRLKAFGGRCSGGWRLLGLCVALLAGVWEDCLCICVCGLWWGRRPERGRFIKQSQHMLTSHPWMLCD
eukprot:scaffold10930_cov102-Isochrysis_galbana.AAC.1